MTPPESDSRGHAYGRHEQSNEQQNHRSGMSCRDGCDARGRDQRQTGRLPDSEKETEEQEPASDTRLRAVGCQLEASHASLAEIVTRPTAHSLQPSLL
jgi:hypothetical protein